MRIGGGRKSTRGRPGFTLISMLVAILLITVAVLPLAQTIERSAAWTTIAAQRSVALELARSYVEDLRGRAPQTLTSESPVLIDGDAQPNAAGPYSRSVEVTTISAFLLRVRVIVTAPRMTTPVELITLVYLPDV